MVAGIAPSPLPAAGPPVVPRWRRDRSPLATRPTPAALYRRFKVTDLFAVLLALAGALLVLNIDRLPNGVPAFLALRLTLQKFLLICALAVSWNAAFSWLGLYRRLRNGAVEGLARVAAACTLGTMPVLLFPLFSASGSFTLRTVVLFWALSVPIAIGMRRLLRHLNNLFAPQRDWDVLIVGSGSRAERLSRELYNPHGRRAQLVGFMDTNETRARPSVRQRWLGPLTQLESVLMGRVVDEVVIALPIKSCYEEIQRVIHTCERLGVQSTYLADLFQPSLGRVGYEHATVHTVKVVQDDFRLEIKRVVDVAGAAVGLVALAPLFLVIALVITLTSPGPVFFSQLRYGLNKRRFRMHKFRTMVQNAESMQTALEQRNEAQGPVFKIRRDPRVTRVGAVLRKCSLDELPQLWNVLRGEMSLVGPRPLPLRDVGLFEQGWLMRRFSMRPGLTCLWQISGRSDVSFDRWVALDLDYIDRWTLRLDAKILLQTIPAVLRGTGAR